MYGSAGRLGVIEISSSVALSAELPGALPPNALAVFARIRLPAQEVSVAALDAMLSSRDLEVAAEQLADADVDLITFACTSGSLIHGPGWDQKLIDRIQAASGIPATTTTTAVVERLRFLGARRIGIGTPYPEDVNEAERRFVEAMGFAVVHMQGLDLKTDREIGGLSLEQVERLALSVAQTRSDVVFLSCTNMPTLGLLDDLEKAVGRPVVSSNSATIWDARRRLDAMTSAAGPHALRSGTVGAARLGGLRDGSSEQQLRPESVSPNPEGSH